MTNAPADNLAAQMRVPPSDPTAAPEAAQILFGLKDPPPFKEGNIFPLEWRTETPKLLEIYERSRDPGWSPDKLPWATLDRNAFTQDQRYALAYWWALLSVFDSSGPAVFAPALIHTYQAHEEEPGRKCFFSGARAEVNHQEGCQRAIPAGEPNGPPRHQAPTPPGQ